MIEWTRILTIIIGFIIDRISVSYREAFWSPAPLNSWNFYFFLFHLIFATINLIVDGQHHHCPTATNELPIQVSVVLPLLIPFFQVLHHTSRESWFTLFSRKFKNDGKFQNKRTITKCHFLKILYEG